MTMYITWQTIILAGSVLGAITALLGALFTVYKWFLQQQKQSKDIERLKEEDTLICFALSACLDGLQQLGANHTVPVAKEKLDKYLNQQAHK